MYCRTVVSQRAGNKAASWTSRREPRAKASARYASDLSGINLSEPHSTEMLFQRLQRWWKLIPVEKDAPVTAMQAMKAVWGLTKGVRVWVALGTTFLV